ncbi:MAG TPA: hypothetical protein VFF80_03935 [Bacillota bacterium]|nr:hypothetical protein [Bacillota bacterium]
MEIRKIQKHKSHTKQERIELLNLYQCSGVSTKAGCEENGIAVSTLHKWLKLDKKQADAKVTQGWAAITVLPQTKGGSVFLQAGKFSIEVRESTDRELLAAVLAMLVPLC